MKIGIIGAMDVEVRHLKGNMNVSRVEKRANMEFCEGTIGGMPVVVVQCGVGKVNAAVCVQVLADVFAVTHVINTGVAGSLNNELNIGDVLVSVDAVHHDVDAQVFGYAAGEVPGMGVKSFAADPALRGAAVAAVHAVAPEIGVLEGRVASGDQFVSDPAVKQRIKGTFHADCCEMEGCSIAQTAWLNSLPFVIVRAISDKADGSDIVDYPTFEAQAAEHCAKIVEHMVQTLAQ
jgi:adenosylhomocysteine nucleosidase